MKLQLMKLRSIEHRASDGSLLWEDSNIDNVFHLGGQQFCLDVLFNTSSGNVVPSSYYLGLDSRLVISDTDTMASLVGEPSGNGYSRQPVSSLNGFSVSTFLGKYQATSGVVVFSGTGAGWGPVRNVWLTNVATGTSGVLISTVALSSPRSVTAGESFSLRFATSLGTC